MACGKTTLGTALQAAHPGVVVFQDLDHIIEAKAGMSVSQIFKTMGEPCFRRMEADTLAEICRHPVEPGTVLVIGCGGGTPCQPHLMDMMLQAGSVVWLLPDADRTLSRLVKFGASRPLVAGKSEAELRLFIESNLAQRLPHYRRAHHIFDSSRLENQSEIDETVCIFYNRFIK